MELTIYATEYFHLKDEYWMKQCIIIGITLNELLLILVAEK